MLSLLAAGMATSWAVTLVGAPQHPSSPPTPDSLALESAVPRQLMSQHPARSHRQPTLAEPVPVESLPSGVARHAGPALFREAIAARFKGLGEAERSSLDSLVASLAVSSSRTPRDPAEMAARGSDASEAVPPVWADAMPGAPVAEPAPRLRAVTPVVVPMPRHVRRSDVAHALQLPLHQTRTGLIPIASAPFPYKGSMPGSGSAFLNASVDGRPAHRTGSGRLYLADETYNDNRSLLHLPRGFNVNEPGVIVLYFHGHGARLERDVWRRQQLPEQISMSGVNAVLVAPQFAVDARDSSIGRFWRPGALRRYLDETAAELARLYGDPKSVSAFARIPVIIVGYSGGYLPAAWGLAHGGVRDRVRGVVLLDALYGYRATFEKFIAQRRDAFFVSAYGRSTRGGNVALKASLEEAGLPVAAAMPAVLGRGSLAVIEATTRHRDYVTNAWAPYPVSDVLRRMPGLARLRPEDRYASRR